MGYIKEYLIITTVGQNVKSIREKKNLTQEIIAYKAGIAISQIGRIERGKLNPSVSTVYRISLALEIEMKELFDFKISLK